MQTLTVLWFDNLKGIGEAIKDTGEIVFLNTIRHKIKPLFPRQGDKIEVIL